MQARPTDDEVMSRMLAGATTTTDGAHENQGDEIKTRMMMTIPISQIDTYDKNPRRGVNPHYLKIKESIRNDGMNQPLVISRRPGKSKFMIYKGGNTRLEAMRNLFEETGDKRFKFVDCCYIPWTGFESDAIIGHLQENEMRKSLCFVDRAKGVYAAIKQIKQELELPDLTLRECLVLLAERGYSTTLGSLSVMNYAVETIDTTLPYELSKQFGRPQIQRIRNLDRVSRKVCKELNIKKSEQLELFRQVIDGFDENNWSIRQFRRSLESHIAHRGSKSIQDIALRMNGYMNLDNKPLSSKPIEVEEELKIGDQANTCTKFAQIAGVYTVNESNPAKIMRSFSALESQADAQLCTLSLGEGKQTGRLSNAKDDVKKQAGNSKKDANATKLKLLRKRSLSAALSIARRYKFQEQPDTKRRIIADVGDWGVGYLVVDFPSGSNKTERFDIAMRDCLWWLLFELCDMHWALEKDRPKTAKFVGNGPILDYVRTAKDVVLHRAAGERLIFPRPLMGLLTMCIRRAGDPTWEDITELIATYRSIHHLAVENNLNLF